MAEEADAVGRPVRIVTVSFPDIGKTVREIAALVEEECARGCDIVALPETWSGHVPEPLDGDAVLAMSAIAARYGSYIVCPIDRVDGSTRYNSAVLLDRAGRVACVYDKAYPYWPELDQAPPVRPGRGVPVHQADFGRIGMAICFDVNFPAVWRQLADQDAELVVWSSAYSAGLSLQPHAMTHQYYVVTATSACHCQVFDITGARILSERADGLQISRFVLDLDRGIYHQNYNLEGRERLLRERADDVAEDQWLEDEQWFVLKAIRPGVSARAIAREYGLEELRDYKRRSRIGIDGVRGIALGGDPDRDTRRS